MIKKSKQANKQKTNAQQVPPTKPMGRTGQKTDFQHLYIVKCPVFNNKKMRHAKKQEYDLFKG